MKASDYEIYYGGSWHELTTFGCPPPTRAPFRPFSDRYDTQDGGERGDGAAQVDWIFNVMPASAYKVYVNDILAGQASVSVKIKTRYPMTDPVTYPAFTAVMHMPTEDADGEPVIGYFMRNVNIKFTNVVAV